MKQAPLTSSQWDKILWTMPVSQTTSTPTGESVSWESQAPLRLSDPSAWTTRRGDQQDDVQTAATDVARSHSQSTTPVNTVPSVISQTTEVRDTSQQMS